MPRNTIKKKHAYASHRNFGVNKREEEEKEKENLSQQQSLYKPGALWKCRSTIYGTNKKGQSVTIKYGELVLLLKYKLTSLYDEECIVLYKEDVVFIHSFNLGHVFNMSPNHQKTK